MTERYWLRWRSGQDDDKKGPSYFSSRDEAGSNGRQDPKIYLRTTATVPSPTELFLLRNSHRRALRFI